MNMQFGITYCSYALHTLNSEVTHIGERNFYLNVQFTCPYATRELEWNGKSDTRNRREALIGTCLALMRIH
jgi:hypothetical protein